MEVESIKCPNCGAYINLQNSKCEYCSCEIMIKSFKSLSNLTSQQINKYTESYSSVAIQYPRNNDVNIALGICFLKLRKFNQSIKAFEKAQENNRNDAEPFFYAAVSRLKGRSPFQCLRTEIDAIEADVNAAISINPHPVYYYFLSYIGEDYFKRKYLKHKPTCEALLQEAENLGLSDDDVRDFHAMVGTCNDIGNPNEVVEQRSIDEGKKEETEQKWEEEPDRSYQSYQKKEKILRLICIIMFGVEVCFVSFLFVNEEYAHIWFPLVYTIIFGYFAFIKKW